MSAPDYLGAPCARLILYLPHRPEGSEAGWRVPTAQGIIAVNSNHWRKILTLLAKVASPVAGQWRGFRDSELFVETALCFQPELQRGDRWHWIAGQANLQRFARVEQGGLTHPEDSQIAVDVRRKLLLSPYPDYRQLSNARVARIRGMLAQSGFYAEKGG